MNDNSSNQVPADIGRRQAIFGGSALAASLLIPKVASAAGDSKLRTTATGIRVLTISFKNNNIDMAGNLYLPKSFSEGSKYPAIVSVHPGGGVKEQTAGLYAQKLAEQGFVTLAFDASHQGASRGMPRLLDDPMRRVADIYSAVDYLTTLGYVDANRIGALGICAGSGTAVKAASLERRIKAVATVSAVDVGAAVRKGWDPAKLAHAIVHLAGLDVPPTRFAGGVDAVAAFETKAKALLAEADAHRELSTSLAHDAE